jgi:predicted ArsR family transcriptional regulator
MPDVSPPHRNGVKGTPSLAERVLELIASGQGTSRAELAERLGASASTISLTVGQLVSRGLVAEQGTRASTGGRPRRAARPHRGGPARR